MAASVQQARFVGLLGAGVVVAFFLPWIVLPPSPGTGLELVAVAIDWRQEQDEAILLVLFAAVPVAGLLTVAAALMRHGVRFLSGLCGALAVGSTGLLMIALMQERSLEAIGIGAYITGGLGLALLSIGLNLVRWP